ncbi:MAG: ABC transporter ATP-binding protein [Flammeovirgaceae bacterium]
MNNNLLNIQHVSKFYANHTALDDVSMSIKKERIFGLLGPNGAGKTSLIRIINQITGADKGTITFNGELLQLKHVVRIGYLPEERGLYKKMKVGEQLIYLSRLKGLTRADVRKRLKYWFEKFEITSWWNKNVEDLSKGMQQKVQFIATILHEPELIILDEPFSGFDPINTNLIKQEILNLRAQGSTIIFSTHRMDSVEELCDDIVLINKSKKVLDGEKAAIKEKYKSNTFIVATEREIVNLPEGFTIKDSAKASHNYIDNTIQILNGKSANDLLQAVIEQGHRIHSLQEQIPSMNDIFISIVGKAEADVGA